MSENRRALVTGASGGIGRAIAIALAKDGYTVTAVARSENKLKALIEEIGSVHRSIAADLADPTGIAAIARELDSGGYDLLVNNAGVGRYGKFDETSLAETSSMLRLNIDALVGLSHAFLRTAKRGAALINVSSTLSFMPFPGSAAYAASKAFVTSFSEGLWFENKDRDVFVGALCPGITRTNFHEAAGGTADQKPPERLSQSSEEVAVEAIAALRSRSGPIAISGRSNAMMVFSTRLMSRKAVVNMMGGFAAKQQPAGSTT